MNLGKVAGQVMENCSIANARNWGSYSICGLLLRLRELFRWERKLKPWETIDHGSLLEWIDGHERLWERLAEKGFDSIHLEGRRYDPFNVEDINRALEGTDHVYGAGYVSCRRPSFFLAEVLDRYSEEGFSVLVLGRELARDLVSYPAMTLGSIIFARKEPLGYHLWEKLLEARGQKIGLLRMAFQDYGYDFSTKPETQEGVMKSILEKEFQACLHHEIGEAWDRVFPEEEWRMIVAGYPGTRIEHFARGVRDILADTCKTGMLSYIITTRNLGSLGLYSAHLSGYRKLLLPDMKKVYTMVREEGDWGLVEETKKHGYEAAREHAKALLELHRRDKDPRKFREAVDELLRRFKF
jgi:hypothetical protein